MYTTDRIRNAVGSCVQNQQKKVILNERRLGSKYRQLEKDLRHSIWIGLIPNIRNLLDIELRTEIMVFNFKSLNDDFRHSDVR